MLLAAALTGCAHAYFVPLPPEAEAHTAHTDDGWDLELVRYHAVGKVSGPPVLLVHGISANGRNMDLDDGHSMARYFAAHGREAWTLSLRGAGTSDMPDESKGRAPFDFDDYWRHDLPAAITTVLKISGAKQLDYVGHSMGGMVLYAYLAEGGQGIHAAATMGSPTRLDWGTGIDALLRAAAGGLLSKRWMVPSSLGAHLTAPLQTAVPDGPMQRFFYNPTSTNPEQWRRLLAYGTADMAGGVGLQLLSIVKTGTFTSADGKLDFKKDMGRIRTPVMVVAGRLDRIALSPAVKDGYRALGGPKEWVLITRANGARGEYGHMDLVIGERAADEVWSKVLGFFDRYDAQGAF